MDTNTAFIILSFGILLVFCTLLAFYFILNLQWYDYKLKRVIFNHHKISWHFVYFFAPLVLSLIAPLYLVCIVYILFFVLWYKKLEQKLVFTHRVIRFFIIYFILFFVFVFISAKLFIAISYLFLPNLLLAHFISISLEYLFFVMYKNKAKKKIDKYKNNGLKIITITASYGKTSIKNYLYEILKNKYSVRATAKSVNTIKGIIADINKNLKKDNEVYIVEAGAREVNDINEIAMFLNASYSIIGTIGKQHIEYFKTLDNIKITKAKLLNSNNLIKAFVDKSLDIKNLLGELDNGDKNQITIYDKNKRIKNIKSDLYGLSFELKINKNDKKYSKFSTKILGKFNVVNLSLAILMANELNINLSEITKSIKNLSNTPHRLQKILDVKNGGKTIIDDSYNGNLVGMCEGVKLCSKHPKKMGIKIILTPGIIESTKKDNKKLAKQINKNFDLVIVTSALNLDVFKKNIDKNKLIFLKNKNTDKMQKVISEKSKNGDLVLFLNDAPSYI